MKNDTILKWRYCFLILLLCIPLIFMGCEESPEEPPAESFLSRESETSSTLEVTESEKLIETEINEAEDGTETEKTETEKRKPTDYRFFHPCFSALRDYKGIVVRWGSVVGGPTHPDFPNVAGNLADNLSKTFMVNVEVLDMVKHEFLNDSVYDFISEMNAIFLPQKALESIVEGGESLVFIDATYARTEEGENIHIGVLQAPLDESSPLPIFRYEDGRMVIADSQMEKRSNGAYKMAFLADAEYANQILREHEALRYPGAYDEYYFRNGMTVEELGKFFYQVGLLPPSD